jgi:DNA-binding NarL/FixJ family response regulator
MESENKDHSNLNSMQAIKILIVDDHKMIRDGLKLMLWSLKKALYFDIEEAESGEEALVKISRKNFQIVIIDYQMPGLSGAETAVRILRHKPQTKILALSNYDELPYVESMIQAGVKGYVLKNIEPSQMLSAIKTILEDKIYFSNEVATKLIETAKKDSLKNVVEKQSLTKREIEVLKMIAMELTNEEIAKNLSVCKRTVDTHRQNLLNKLHAKNTVGLVKAAYKLSLIK